MIRLRAAGFRFALLFFPTVFFLAGLRVFFMTKS